MLNRFLMSALLGGAMALTGFAAPANADEVSKKDLNEKRLAQMAEQADDAEDFRQLSRLYELRAEMLEQKAERHDRLQQRYAAAPKSLLAKRGHGWNTPGRQEQLADAARDDAADARRLAGVHVARADSMASDVD